MNRSANDCAVVVLRAIFAHGHPGKLHAQEFVDDNPLLKFALADFSAETEPRSLAVEQARHEMFEIIQEKWQLPNPINCASILESVPMLETLWSTDRMRLYQPVVCRDNSASAGKDVWKLYSESRTTGGTLEEIRHGLVR